jgi:hemerythrin-like domain-containing protein
MTTQSKSKSRSRAPASPTDGISLLKKDHAEVRSLLNKLNKTTTRDGEQRQKLLREIELSVKAHTTIEEEIFYPAFKETVRSDTGEKLYFEAVEEHHVVDLVMAELKGTGVEVETFAARAKVLKDLIEHHAEEEETQMFPKARKAMSRDALRDVGQQMEQRKQQLIGGSFRGKVVNLTKRAA